MYCSQCGYQLSDDAIFCQRCGTKIQKFETNSRLSQSSCSELSRDAIKIYLGDILALECIKNKYEGKLRKVNAHISDLKNHNYYERLVLNKDNQYLHLFYDGRTSYFACDARGDESRTFWGVWVSSGLYGRVKWLEVEKEWDWLKTMHAWQMVTYPDTEGLFSRPKRKAARDVFPKIYKEFQARAPLKYQENAAKIASMDKLYSGIYSELNNADRILQKAYQVNIIPSSFRNSIYAVYYLFDFINTSRESLSTALLHYDLNEIKKKLDTIIEQQQEIIIQQAIALSQNKQLLQQNQLQLERLSNIESNTSQAAQYSKIAAFNAEASAWISLANYLDK